MMISSLDGFILLVYFFSSIGKFAKISNNVVPLISALLQVALSKICKSVKEVFCCCFSFGFTKYLSDGRRYALSFLFTTSDDDAERYYMYGVALMILRWWYIFLVWLAVCRKIGYITSWHNGENALLSFTTCVLGVIVHCFELNRAAVHFTHHHQSRRPFCENAFLKTNVLLGWFLSVVYCVFSAGLACLRFSSFTYMLTEKLDGLVDG